jgi:antitoxin component of RelBE/YafQ-DinJ toxin-antitoxin module
MWLSLGHAKAFAEMELKTARLTVLIDPSKKEAFEALCHAQDMTPSQVVRRLIREYMEEQGAPPAPRRRAAAAKKRGR